MSRIMAMVFAVLFAGALVAPAVTLAQPAAERPPAGAEAAPPVDPEPMAIRSKPRKPAGMWGGTRPARGGAYKYPYLIIGTGALAVTGVVVMFYLRRVSRQRAS